jgi:hypothetical protein
MSAFAAHRKPPPTRFLAGGSPFKRRNEPALKPRQRCGFPQPIRLKPASSDLIPFKLPSGSE